MNRPGFNAAEYRVAVSNAEAEAIPALQRLMAIGERGDSSGETRVRRFLLGLYNGGTWAFDLTALRGIDNAVLDDVFTVLKLDAYYCQREIHTYLEDGAKRFNAMWAIENPEDFA